MNEKPTVCFLRGINVSGRNMIKMTDLAPLFKGFGIAGVSTYLQSGNVVFSNSKGLKESGLSELIKTRIKKKLGLDVHVVIRTREEIESILINNIFLMSGMEDTDKLYVIMLDRNPDQSRLDGPRLTDFSPEKFEIRGREVYIFCPDGYSRAKLNNNFFEKKLSSIATTRNWKTMIAVSEMMK